MFVVDYLCCVLGGGLCYCDLVWFGDGLCVVCCEL